MPIYSLAIRKCQDKRFLNVVALIIFFVVGQGIFFLAQTSFMLAGDFALIGSLGIAFLCVTFMTQIVDWGAQSVITRVFLTRGRADAVECFWRLTASRLLVATTIYPTALIAVQAFGTEDSFYFHYLMIGGIACFIQAFSPSGLIDGIGASGATGAATAAPFLCTGITLSLCSPNSTHPYGTHLGSAMLLGHSLGAISQLYTLRRLSIQLTPVQMKFDAKFCEYSLEGWSCLLTTLPGQLFYRAQVGAVALVSTEATGAFVYSKQIINSVSQVLLFARRADVNNFVKIVNEGGKLDTQLLTRTPSFGLGALSTLAVAIVAILTMFTPYGTTTIVPQILFALSITLFTVSTNAIIVQWFIFREKATVCSAIISSSALLGVVLVFALTSSIGPLGAAFGEMIIHAFQITLLFYIAKKSN